MLLWHLQPTRLTARGFTEGGCYEDRDSPQVIAQVDLRSDGSAFIHAAMSRDGSAISPGMWRGLARQLRELGVSTIDWEHKGKAGRVTSARV